MTNSKIEIYVRENTILFKLYLKLLLISLNLRPKNIVFQRSKVSIILDQFNIKKYLIFVKLIFKPYNIFEIKKLTSTY